MRVCNWLFGLTVCVALLGCSNSVPTQEPIDLPPKQPLSVAEWKELPVSVKYDPTTFERLKLNDPKLKNEADWDKFMKEVVVPERKKDIPDEEKGTS